MAKDVRTPGTNSGANTPPTKTAANAAESALHKELDALRDRDALQRGMVSLVDFLESNKLLAIAVVVIALIGGLGYVGWNKMSTRREQAAQDAFYQVEKPFAERREKFDQARFAALSGAKLDELVKAGTAIKASGDLTKDYGALIDNLETFAKTHLGTTAGVQAALMAAETRIQYKQADQALGALEASAQATKPTTLAGALARMAAGNAQASAGKCDQALKFWEEILATKESSFLHGEAALRAGLCLEKSGDKARAIEMYRKASSESERSTSAQTARMLLRALELGT